MDDKLYNLHLLDIKIKEQKKLVSDEKHYLGALEEQRKRSVGVLAQEMVDNGCVNSIVRGLRFSVVNAPRSVVIVDEKELSDKYIREKITTSPNKVLIKEDLENGVEVRGATLNNGGITLRITSTRGE